MPKNIIFDFGGVLINWDPNHVYRQYFSNEAEITQFYTETAIFELNKDLDKGLAFDTGLQKLAEQFPHYQEPIFFWRDRWTDMIRGPIFETVAILKQLYGQGYPLYGLTNWSAETFPYVLNKYEFFKYFKDIVVSGKEGVIKPDLDIFHILLERNNLIPEDCIFIDDNLHNLNTAKAIGMATIHFQSAENLSEHLQALLSA